MNPTDWDDDPFGWHQEREAHCVGGKDEAHCVGTPHSITVLQYTGGNSSVDGVRTDYSIVRSPSFLGKENSLIEEAIQTIQLGGRRKAGHPSVSQTGIPSDSLSIFERR